MRTEKKKFGILIASFLMALLFFTAVKGRSISAPVIPNESVVNGTVVEYSIVSSHLIGIKPEQIIYNLTINIESAKSVNDRPNFLNNKEGQNIQFYSREKLSPELFGKKIKAVATYTGDEKGGLYWIKYIETIK